MRCCLFLIVCIGVSVAADQVQLLGGDRLTGEVLALTAEGLTLQSTISEQKLELRTAKVRSLQFSQPNISQVSHDAQLTLVNGDVLPCDLLNITEEEIFVETNYVGKITIPRKVVSSIHLGIKPRSILYNDAPDYHNWEINSGWRLEEGKFSSEGQGYISREFENLPDSFSIEFELEWYRWPQFDLYLCSDTSQPGNGEFNRYRIEFRRRRINLQRQTGGTINFHSLGSIPNPPELLGRESVHVEIFINRKLQQISLFLNDTFYGRFQDPLPNDLSGNQVIFANTSNNNITQRLGKIILREWQVQRSDKKTKAQEIEKRDSFIDIDGQRFSGLLKSLSKAEKGRVLRFKTPFQKTDIQVPFSRLSALFFTTENIPSSSEGTISLELIDRGLLRVNSCNFSKDSAIMEHPLLGKLTLNRSALISMAYRQSQEKDKSNTDS